jgi:hypothetical protein
MYIQSVYIAFAQAYIVFLSVYNNYGVYIAFLSVYNTATTVFLHRRVYCFCKDILVFL